MCVCDNDLFPCRLNYLLQLHYGRVPDKQSQEVLAVLRRHAFPAEEPGRVHRGCPPGALLLYDGAGELVLHLYFPIAIILICFYCFRYFENGVLL